MWFLEKEEQELINKITPQYPFTRDLIIGIYLNSGRSEKNTKEILSQLVVHSSSKF